MAGDQLKKLVFPSLGWAEELCRRANKDKYLREIGKGFSETITIIINDRDNKRRALKFIIEDGKCMGVYYNERLDEIPRDSDLILEADIDTWLKIIRFETTPTKALFTRKLRIVKGSRLMIFSRPLAHYQILYLASKISEGI